LHDEDVLDVAPECVLHEEERITGDRRNAVPRASVEGPEAHDSRLPQRSTRGRWRARFSDCRRKSSRSTRNQQATTRMSGSAPAAQHPDGRRQALAARRRLRQTLNDLLPLGLIVEGEPDAAARLDAIDVDEAGWRLARSPSC